MIVAANHLDVADDYAGEFVDRFRDTMEAAVDEPGFVRFELLAPERAETHVVVTYWETIEDFEAWTDSESFAAAHDVPDEMLAGSNQFEIHEVAFEQPRETEHAKK